MKKFIKFALLFITVVTFLLISLTLVSAIPNSLIKKNMIKSAEFYSKHDGIEYKIDDYKNTMVHYYADSIILNIIYNLDNKKPLKSVMEARYYEERYMDVNDGFIDTVLNNKKANHEYIRYWHGSILILKPLLVLFNIETIYLINKILLYFLSILVLFKIYKKSKKAALAYLIGMIATTFFIVPYCFEYSWVFYIMLISCLYVTLHNEEDKLYSLFFINGILTCFFDFLSCELITLFVPLILYLWFNHKKFKTSFKVFIKCLILWSIAYILMWFSKWIIASFILGYNTYPYIVDKAMLRVNGLQGVPDKSIMYRGLLYRNVNYLFPLSIMENRIVIYFVIALILLFIDYKNIMKHKLNIVLFIIALMPYARYFILANHSYRHAFFTFREEIITIMSLILIVFNSLNYDLIISEIKKVKKWN